MANRVAAPNLFAPVNPNWSLPQLDQNAQNAAGAINDSSLGAVNGPLADTGSVNAYSVACAYGTPSAYNNGMTVFFTPGNTNTGASTLTVSPLSSLPIVSASGSALVGGELQAGQTAGVVCDGSAFRIFSMPITPVVTAVRLRSFNAIGNPNFEIDQRNCGNALVLTGNAWLCDRVNCTLAGTHRYTSQQVESWTNVPGTNYAITQSNLRLTLTTAQASLGATDSFTLWTGIEGPMARPLLDDVHSLSLLVRSSIANTKFSVVLEDASGNYNLAKLCTIPSANTWTLITLPNLPLWTPSGTFNGPPGLIGYWLGITLAGGSGIIIPANDTWQASGHYVAVGCGNFSANPVNSTFDLAFIQHESGSVCTTLIDCPFVPNYNACQRYYQKSYGYSVKPGTVTYNGEGTAVAANLAYAYGGMHFRQEMAAIPTVTLYPPNTGGPGGVLDINNSTVYGASGTDVSTSGMGSIYNSGNQFIVGHVYTYQWVMDSGW